MENYIANAVHHLHTIDKHRALVFVNCVRAGIPLQGLVHDLSKYSPTEFLVGVKYFQGDHSPNVEERKEKGYSAAWMHHKGRNKHHFEYWFDNSTTAFNIVPVEMPTKYVIEMFCDRVAASKVYHKDSYQDDSALKYFQMHDYSAIMQPNTQKLLRELLQMMSDEGEAKTFAYIRKMEK